MVIRFILLACSLWLVGIWFEGIDFTNYWSILVAAAVLTLINTFVRPVLIFLTIPISIVSLGVFILVINGFCLYLTASLLPGFSIQGFWSAFWGSLVIMIVSSVLNLFFNRNDRERNSRSK